MADLSPDDITWLRRIFAGRSPEDITRLKALLEAHCAPLDDLPFKAAAIEGAAARQADAAAAAESVARFDDRQAGCAAGAGLPVSAQLALLGITDDLGALRAHLIALDMACAGLQDADDRNALRTTADTILAHLHTIRETVDDLRGAPPRN